MILHVRVVKRSSKQSYIGPIRSQKLGSMHCTAIVILKYTDHLFPAMTSPEKTNITKARRRTGEGPSSLLPITRHMDDIFEDFRRDMESMFSHVWPYSMTGWQFPVLADTDREIRLPVC